MYNPYQGQYGQYGAAPGAPPGMGAPGMAAPGTGAPPGMPGMHQHQQEAHQPGRPGAGFPPNFQPPANMPNINFSAPVIRLGTGGSMKPDASMGGVRDDRGGRRAGVGSGMDREPRGGDRERPQPIQPQTKEDIIRTLFVGGITEGAGGDEGVERILRAAGNLRRWFRATDADDRPCKFGFAEYDDPESLRTAIEVLKDIEIPVKQRRKTNQGTDDEQESEEIQKSKLLVVADENSETYIEQWEESQGGANEDHKQMLIDQAREALQAVLADLENPSSGPKDELSGIDRDGDTAMVEGQNADGDVVTIPLSADDELSDIPAEMRETVAKEIAAFRDRSNKRDLERLKREEEIELQERSRMVNGSRGSRLASPPPTAPSGPAGANGVPVGPRGAAPSGPKALASGFPKDYQKGVTFVNGTGISAASAFDEDDTDASDDELERRRNKSKEAENEKHYLDQERRWLNRERSRTAAVEREKNRDQEEASRDNAEKEAMAKRLRDFDDDSDATRKGEDYYSDHSMWIRNRAAFRQREATLDDADRSSEQREQAREVQQRERAGALADDFLSRQEDVFEQHQRDDVHEARDISSRREPARFKMALGAAAQKQQANAAAQQAQKRTVAEVEGLLEDEEDQDQSQRRKIVPIQYDKSDVVRMSEEERAEAAKQLASEIPNDKEGLWNWAITWDYVDETVIEDRLKPFVEKKIVEYLGVQEQMVVDVVVNALRNRSNPGDLVGELEGALDEEEAEVLVRKLWRMVVFFSESEKRGLSA